MAEPFRHRMRVRFNECDPQGVVFYANYLMYFDVAITEFWRAALGSYEVLLAEGVDLMVAEAGIRYLAPARLDEEIELVARVTSIGRTSSETSMSVERPGSAGAGVGAEASVGAGDPELLVEGRLRHVFVDARTLAKREIPGKARAALERFLAEPSAVPG